MRFLPVPGPPKKDSVTPHLINLKEMWKYFAKQPNMIKLGVIHYFVTLVTLSHLDVSVHQTTLSIRQC